MLIQGATFIPESRVCIPTDLELSNRLLLLFNSHFSATLDSGIDVAPGITVAPPPKNFHITILILFYINLGIAVIKKINKRTPLFIPESRVVFTI